MNRNHPIKSLHKAPQLTGNVKLYREAMKLVKRVHEVLDQIERKLARQDRDRQPRQ